MQISQGYIIRILQHFATKLWNITNFVMLFHAMMEFCLDLLRSKFWLIWEWSIELQVFWNHCLASKQGIATIHDALNYCSKFKELFPLTLRCLKLVLTALVKSASSERSFSKLKLIKILIRSTTCCFRIE